MPRAVPVAFAPRRIDDDLLIDDLREEDEAAFLTLMTSERERLARWFPFAGSVMTPKRYARHLASARAAERLGLGCDLAIRVDGQLAGSIQLHHVDPFNALADVGYWLSATVARRKVMTRVLPVVAAYAFGVYRIHRLQLITDVANVASRTVAERAGFTLETILRDRFVTPDGHSDGALYVKLAP